MKLTKIFMLFILIFILSGCATTYELKIDGSKFQEKITTYIYKGDRETASYDDEFTGSRIDAFVEYDVYPYFENYEISYDKKVKKLDNYEEVILNYEYKDSEYKKSNAINLCFENRNFEITEDYYNIDLTGYFYCLYDNKNFDIQIATNNKVVEHNADDKKGNKYIWHIDNENFKNVDVKIKFSKESKKNEIYLFLFILIIIVLSFSMFWFIKNRIKENNKI